MTYTYYRCGILERFKPLEPLERVPAWSRKSESGCWVFPLSREDAEKEARELGGAAMFVEHAPPSSSHRLEPA